MNQNNTVNTDYTVQYHTIQHSKVQYHTTTVQHSKVQYHTTTVQMTLTREVLRIILAVKDTDGDTGR